MAARNDTLARSISSCSTQFHARGEWVLNPVTTANEQTRKVRLPNNKTVDRLLPLNWGNEDSITDWTWLSQASPFVLYTGHGAAWLAGVDSCLSQPG